MARGFRTPSRGKAVKEIQAGIRRLTRGFRMLARDILRDAARTEAPPRARISPGRQLHGRYIGLIRNLPVRVKARVRAVRARRGVEAAIRMARELRHPR